MEINWHHVAISVKDLNKALTFYCNLLGFEVDWDRDHYSGEQMSRVVGLSGADAHVVMHKGHGTRLELFQYYTPEGEDGRPIRQCDFGLTHFALSVKNIHALYERLLEAGVEFNCPPQNLRPGVWATYMKDHEGVTIELVQYD
ncbi:MAG: VOC family protein [Deltaproteobacteria bacterium]|nr:VOC family protein [Deltaproteobacteria bacterium]